MVTNRNRKSFKSCRKISKSCADGWQRWLYDPRSGISGPSSLRASTCPNLHGWCTQPSHVRCPVAQLLISRNPAVSWISSIISGVVTVLGRPGQGASQVEKSPRLNWTTQFLMVAYDGACFPILLSEWREFPSTPCLTGKQTWRQLASRCYWNRARRLTSFLSASVTRKDLQFGT
jgi:hypothetical protein